MTTKTKDELERQVDDQQTRSTLLEEIDTVFRRAL